MAVSAGPDIIEDGLVLCLDAGNRRSYPGSGTTWFDISGRGNHFTLVNSPTFSSENRFVFNGINQNAVSSTTVAMDSNNITVQFLFKPNSYSTYNGSNSKLVFEHSANFNSNNDTFVHYYVGDAGSSDIVAGTKGSGGYNYSYIEKSFYNDLTWKFCNIIFDRRVTGTTRETYFYTQATERTPISTPLTTDNSANFGTYTFYIGARGGASNFADMELSYFSIYSRVLTATEISQNFNALRGRFGL
jgi:hypothetical protein